MHGETTLVCVTAQRSCQRLIHRGAEIARSHDTPLLVLSVSGSGFNVLTNPSVSAIMNELYTVSAEVGAEMTMLQSTTPKAAIASFMRERQVKHLVLGQGRPDPNGMVAQLMIEFPEVIFHVEPGA